MEALILRRNFPIPVTFADLRRAYQAFKEGWCRSEYDLRSFRDALKETTGATDDVYAVVDGREVHVAHAMWLGVYGGWDHDGGCNVRPGLIDDLLERADEQGYWERPHEVRLQLGTGGAS